MADESPATIRVRVLDDSGTPLAWASVYFVSAPVPVPDIAALTDEAGSVELSAPAAGTYTVGARAEGWEAGTAAVVVPEEDARAVSSGADRITVDLTLLSRT